LTNGVRRWNDGVLVEREQYAYAFDDIGNRKSTLQGGDNQGLNLRTASYTNNTLNQITGRAVPGKVDIIGTSTAANSVTVNGNTAHRRGSFFRHELTISNSATNAAWTSVTVSADTSKSGNLLTPPARQNFYYDADGNLTNDMVWSYVWDGENRLVEVRPLTNSPAASKRWLKFTYDWRRRRIQKTAATWNTGSSSWSLSVSNRFLYSGWNLIGELNATNNSLIRGYIWGPDVSGTLQGAGGVGGLVGINDPVNGAQFVAYDDQGNLVGMVKVSDGSVTATYEYDPFGQLIRASGSYAAINPIHFSGKYYDDEVGLSYFDYRYYSANLGRWINRDPIEEFGGFNIYGFVGNDPAWFVDPYGLDYDDSWDPRTWFNGGALEGWSDAANSIGESLGGLLAGNLDQVANAQDLSSHAYNAITGFDPTGVLPTDPDDPYAEVAATLGMTASMLDGAGEARLAKKAIQKCAAKKTAKIEANAAKKITKKIPKPPKGKGSVPPGKRDPKRVFPKGEKAEALDERGGACEQCGKKLDIDDAKGHHIERHADGGPTRKDNLANVCEDCHKELHE
jgi:RHS repeat-associated protein